MNSNHQVLKYEEFPELSKEKLIEFALTALRDTLAQDKELNSKNTTVAIVSTDEPNFTIYDDDDVQQWLDLLDTLSNARVRGGDADAAEEEEAEEEDAAAETAATDPDAPASSTTAPVDRDDMETDE
ncbi:unnamed protein product [[Candida] boidinii]|uniref:Unnamed protein product n=1 Tax=Candida boidinii TaxID=5477 RepID=A0A9W6WKA2_CANBO|nr:unnamed protein product [[Candida] boidinii]